MGSSQKRDELSPNCDIHTNTQIVISQIAEICVSVGSCFIVVTPIMRRYLARRRIGDIYVKISR